MAERVTDIHHMITIWNASGHPPYIQPTMMRSLADYLVDYLKSQEGEKFLRTLGYVRAGAAVKK